MTVANVWKDMYHLTQLMPHAVTMDVSQVTGDGLVTTARGHAQPQSPSLRRSDHSQHSGATLARKLTFYGSTTILILAKCVSKSDDVMRTMEAQLLLALIQIDERHTWNTPGLIDEVA